MSTDSTSTRPAEGASLPETAPDALGDALAGVREVLERDGFEADWDVDATNGVHFRVRAGTAACHECLVPAAVMEAIVDDALEGTPYTVRGVELPASPDEPS